MKKETETNNKLSYKLSFLLSIILFMYLTFIAYLYFFIYAIIPDWIWDIFELILFVLITSWFIYKLWNINKFRKIFKKF